MDKEKYTNLVLMSYMGTIWHYLATDWNTKKRDTQMKVSKTNRLIIFLFLCFYFVAFLDILDCEYDSFAFLDYVWLNFKEREDKIL